MNSKSEKSIVNNRYHVVKTLGGGAQGQVLEVIDALAEDRRLALKTLTKGVPGSLLRFEFEQLTKLDHPHLVEVYDLGVVTETFGADSPAVGTAFFTQELVPGIPAHIWAATLSEDNRTHAIAKVGVAVTRALEWLHSRGLLHRDIKPSNILVGRDGDLVKLIDLGLACRTSGPDGLRAGTLAYMAPEALRGFPDERSDLFGLGVTLAELFTGAPPKAGTPLSKTAAANLPAELWKLLSRLVEPLPERRLQSARETVLALGRALGGGVLDREREAELLDATSEIDTSLTRATRVRTSDLIGRTEERAALDQWLNESLAAEAESPSLAVIAGPPGVGKSRLCRAAVVDTQLKFSARGDTPPTMIHGSLRNILSAVSCETDLRESPNLACWLRGIQPDQNVDDQATQGGLLLGEMARSMYTIERPCVFSIEGADDALVMELLAFLSDRTDDPHDSPIAVIAEMRNDSSARRAAAQSDALLLDIRPLGLDDEAAMLSQVLLKPPNKELVKRVHQITGGVPLLTEAVLAVLQQRRTGFDSTTKRLDALALEKHPGGLVRTGLLGVLDEPVRTITEAFAVIGCPAALDEIMSVAGIDDADNALFAMGRLERLGWLIRDSEDRLSLSGFIAHSLVDALSKSKARGLHERALLTLRKRPETDPSLLAHHAALAQRSDEARALARRAANMLEATGDLAGAAEQLELLLTLGDGEDDDAVMAELARICRQTGLYDRAIALAISVEQGGGSLAPRAALERAAALRLSGQGAQALAVFEKLCVSADRDVALEARTIAARICLDRGDVEAAAARIGELPNDADPRLVRSGTLATAGLIALQQGNHDRAQVLFVTGLEAAEKSATPRDRARYHGLIGMVFHARNSWESAAKSYRAALDLADSAGDRHGAATYAVNLAAAYTELGRVRDALDCYNDGLGRLRRIGRAAELAQAGANYAELLGRVGDTTGAETASKQALEDAEQTASDRVIALAACVRGDVLCSVGGLDQAAALLERAERLASETGATFELVSSRQHLAECALKGGDLNSAAQWLADAEQAGADSSGQLELEQKRLQLELAVAEGRDPQQSLDQLLSTLPTGNDALRMNQVDAFATAARVASQHKNTQIAERTARNALEILTKLEQATPSLHREAENPLTQEMKEICMATQDEQTLAQSDARISAGAWEHLVRINTRLNSELRVARLLELIMDAAIDITGAERGFLLISDLKGELKVRCARNIDQESLAPGEQSFSRSVALKAFELGEPVLTTDAQEDERFQSMLSVVSLNLRYVAAVPLQVKGRTTGTIYLDSRSGGRFDEPRMNLLRALADQAAIALTNARLTHENRHRQRKIERLNQQLSATLDNREGELEKVKDELSKRTDDLIARYRYQEIVARSTAMDELFKLLDRVVDSDLPVIVEGESGTGKELVARALHFNGPRKRKPFVAENCAAIPETLLESVLFGHARGAFTGAVRDSRGLFVEANGGTLFLDEVSAMPLAMQVKLLRVLQDGAVRPVGGPKTTQVDVRVIVASNANLGAMVKQGRFREDLYYRLNVVCLELPPLRRRTEDIPLLAAHFTTKHGGKSPPKISREAIEALIEYPWPGNVRQLENEIMRATVLSDDVIDIEHLSPELLTGISQLPDSIIDLNMNRQVESLKRRLVSVALKRTGGNQTAAAKLLGLSRYGLQKMLTRFESPSN